MTMNKFFTGLIAFVAGVALSAGSAFAQAVEINGYVGGDSAMIKLVPYFETGAMKATIIGVQNMSSARGRHHGEELMTSLLNTAMMLLGWLHRTLTPTARQSGCNIADR